MTNKIELERRLEIIQSLQAQEYTYNEIVHVGAKMFKIHPRTVKEYQRRIKIQNLESAAQSLEEARGRYLNKARYLYRKAVQMDDLKQASKLALEELKADERYIKVKQAESKTNVNLHPGSEITERELEELYEALGTTGEDEEP